MMGTLSNHLWQSTVFAIGAGLLTLLFRRNRAQVRYWLWFTASVKFLIPLSLFINIASQITWAPAGKRIAVPTMSVAVVQIAEPFPEITAQQPRDTGAAWPMRVIWAVWIIGFAVVVLNRLRLWRQIRALIRISAPFEIPGAGIPAKIRIRSTPGLMEPGVVGWLRPILLLPAGITERLNLLELKAVLAHECCHIRRRDNLTSGLHMIVEAVFWFHPLVWWIGTRLVEERERACDEEVLRLGNEALVYAESILRVCRTYLESPLPCVPGVTGSDLKKRVQSILSGTAVMDLGFGRKAALLAAALWAAGVPLLAGMVHAASRQDIVRPANIPKWEAVSIKPCPPPRPGQRGGVPEFSPGRAAWNCQNIFSLIQTAYSVNPIILDLPVGPQMDWPLEGGPPWLRSDPYQVIAKAEGIPGRDLMTGPMLQVLLEDRFNLKIHRESRDTSVYLLTVSKSGAKLETFKEGSCLLDPNRRPGQLTALPAGQRRCNMMGGFGANPVNYHLVAEGIDLDRFAGMLFLDRKVINRTGITGRFDFDIEYAREGAAPQTALGAGPDVEGPSVRSVLDRLGLKLEAAKAPADLLVIDSVTRPTEN